MTVTDLPGLTVRPIELSDVPAIHAQTAAYTSAVLGFAKHGLDDVESYLHDPAMDLATDSWLVFDGAELVGNATANPASESRVHLDVVAADPAVAAWLLDTATNRAVEQCRVIEQGRAAGEHGKAAGERTVMVGLGILRDDRMMPPLAADRGFAVETSVHRMEIRHTTALESPAVPDGVVIRRGAFDDATRRAAHMVIAESFADQPDATPRPYEEWLLSRERRPTFDWSQLTTLEVDGKAVAIRECNDNFVRSEGCGYIGRLGVLREARGRGLATFLLRDAFALDAAAGLTGTILHVDSSNPTPARQLYLGVGMRSTVITDAWRKLLPV
jgi:ribosomal protein S18 acetylase RimI-like enzyme